MKDEKKQGAIISEKTLKKIKLGLLARKKTIMDELNAIEGSNVNKNDKHKPHAKFPDFGDKIDENAQEVDEYSTSLETEKVLEKTSRDIDNALERIKNNTYGICKYCNKSIGEKRLLARPVASACVDCKNKLQQTV